VATLLAVLLQVSPATAGALERAILGKSAIVDLSHSEGERQGPLPSGSVGKDFGTRLNALGIVRKDKRTIAQIPLRVNERQVQGVGLDAFTPDAPSVAGGDAPVPIVPPGAWLIENLANLDRLPIKDAKLIVAPLRLEAASASARVIAILP
jgi:hypothetical protein